MTDSEIVLQKKQKCQIKIDLLDTSYTKIAELQGYATTLSGTISTSSDIRRVANLTMHVSSKEYLVENHSNLWLNRIVQISVGVDDDVGETQWYLIGSYVISDVNTKIDEKSQELTLPLVDMMATATEKRGSKINGYGLTINAGTNVREAIISVITSFMPFHSYSIPEFSDTIPYDLEFGIGVYPYEVLSKILSLWPTYEMYYTPAGVFTVAEIPTCIEDEIFIDYDIIDKLIISETKDSSFSNVKNTTEIMGRSIDADYTAETCTTSGTTYNLYIDDEFEVLEDGSLFSFIPDSTSASGQTIKIQSTTEYAIYNQGATTEDDVAILAGAMVSGIPYCVKYTENRFYLQGELEIHAIVQERNVALSAEDQAQFKIDTNCRDVEWVINPDSPYSVEEIGTIWNVLSDGEYEDIYTTSLALERAKYENWKTTRLEDKVTLSTMFIPWIDVNKKIRYHSLAYGRTMSSEFSMDGTNVVLSPWDGTPPYKLSVVDGVLSVAQNPNYLELVFSIDTNGNLVVDDSAGLGTYIVQSISFDCVAHTMTIEASTFYPYLPF